jgi:hypothetical protein
MDFRHHIEYKIALIDNFSYLSVNTNVLNKVDSSLPREKSFKILPFEIMEPIVSSKVRVKIDLNRCKNSSENGIQGNLKTRWKGI